MRVYTYSEARQHLSEVLRCAEKEEVVIKRRDGSTFSVLPTNLSSSPFDVPGIRTKATTQNILDAVNESRKA